VHHAQRGADFQVDVSVTTTTMAILVAVAGIELPHRP
jgi:hypothetical protein